MLVIYNITCRLNEKFEQIYDGIEVKPAES